MLLSLTKRIVSMVTSIRETQLKELKEQKEKNIIIH